MERFIPCQLERRISSGHLTFSSPGVLDTWENAVAWNFEGGDTMKLIQRDALLMLLNAQPERAPELRWIWEPMDKLPATDSVTGIPKVSKHRIMMGGA